MRPAILAGVCALAAAGGARAEVVDRSPAGFEVRYEQTLDASQAKVRAAVLDVGRWWDAEHTYSGDARNMSIDLATGCFCEKLKDGFVRHMTVVYSAAGGLTLAGALGPLQTTGASGHMAFVFKPAGPDRTVLTMTYDVGGYVRGGLAETWAGPVDQVLDRQMKRLGSLIATGKPD
ncbi:MAG TPA: ATPase [Phenylobacterium sp.]|nr:ATPase [Phenylobacterium sp.]